MEDIKYRINTEIKKLILRNIRNTKNNFFFNISFYL